MPHIPRSTASMSGVRPELLASVRADRPPLPPPAEKTAEKTEKSKRVGLGSLSIKDFEPDFDQLVKTMFGTEAKHDDNTGQLVLTQSPAATGPAIRT